MAPCRLCAVALTGNLGTQESTLKLPIVLVPHPHVRVDRKVLAGSPYIAGSRVPVRRIYGFYRDGISIERLMKRYPQLEPAQIFDALAFALDNLEVIEADIALERELIETKAGSPQAKANRNRQIALPFDSSSEGDGDAAPDSRPKRRH